MTRFQILDWDSEFFGMTVARILPDKLSTPELERTIASLKENGVTLAYWASDPSDAASQQAARSCSGFLADRKTTYLIDLEGAPGMACGGDWVMEEYAGAAPNDELVSLALQAGAYSRFRIDPRMPDGKFVALYKRWIESSVNRKIADTVLVVRHSGRIVGMVTVGEKNGRGDIGLIAVDAGMRGKNVGVSLVRGALEWMRGKRFRFAQVVTQGENAAACRMYERCGYRVEKIEFVHHFWI